MNDANSAAARHTGGIEGGRVWPALSDGGNETQLVLDEAACLAAADFGSIDARIRSLTARQAGCVARWQLIAAGIAARTIDGRLASGSLQRVHATVYGVPPMLDVPFNAEVGALLAVGGDARLSYHSACVHWKMRTGIARPVHLTVGFGRHGRRLSGVTVHRTRLTAAPEVTAHQGLPVTTAARTVLDVATHLPPKDTGYVIAEGYARHVLTEAALHAELARCGAHPGRGNLEAALNLDLVALLRSDHERILYELIVEAGLPRPQTNVWVLDYELDMLWRDLGLVVEVDAYGTHGSRARFNADRRRDARLRTEAGLTTVRITKETIEHQPLVALATVAQAITQAQERLRRQRSA